MKIELKSAIDFELNYMIDHIKKSPDKEEIFDDVLKDPKSGKIITKSEVKDRDSYQLTGY